MSQPEERISDWKSPGRFSFGLRDLLFAVVATAIGAWCARQSSIDVGLCVAALVLLAWHVRHVRYAVVPGAALGVLAVWFTMTVGANERWLMSQTALAATVGAATNCMFRGYWLGGVSAYGIALVSLLLRPD